MANLDYNDFRRRDCVWRMVLPANSLKLLNGGMAPSYSGHPARAPPGARASTSSDRSTAASTASFNPVPLQTAKVVLTPRAAIGPDASLQCFSAMKPGDSVVDCKQLRQVLLRALDSVTSDSRG